MEQFDHMVRTLHKGIVNAFAGHHAAHGHGAGIDAFGKGHHVGHNAIAFGGERCAQTAEAGDDFVENQQNAVFIADIAQAL